MGLLKGWRCGVEILGRAKCLSPPWRSRLSGRSASPLVRSAAAFNSLGRGAPLSPGAIRGSFSPARSESSCAPTANRKPLIGACATWPVRAQAVHPETSVCRHTVHHRRRRCDRTHLRKSTQRGPPKRLPLIASEFVTRGHLRDGRELQPDSIAILSSPPPRGTP